MVPVTVLMLVLMAVSFRMPVWNRFQVYSAGLIIDGIEKTRDTSLIAWQGKYPYV
jgi:hypothetical protein